jgi:predicted DNA-binding transcriptional regulator YafY
VVLLASPRGFDEASWLARRGARSMREHTLLDNGWTRCVVAFESLDEAFVDVLRLGPEVEVVEPEPLRARVAETATAVSALYA